MPDDAMSLAGVTTKASVPDPVTVSAADMLSVVVLLVVSVKTIVALLVPLQSALAFELTVKVTVVGDVVTVPEVDDAVSQVGTPEIE